MPRDVTGFEPTSDRDTAATQMMAVETVSACYVCGAWADDVKRCRHPGSSSCIQANRACARNDLAAPGDLTRH